MDIKHTIVATDKGAEQRVSAPITLQMVATAAGVSKATASRAINNGTNVSPSKRAAVLKAAAQLGFVPNTIAQALVGGRAKTIGVIAQYLGSPFYATVLRGLEEVVTEAGFGLVVSSGHWNRLEEESCVRSLRAARVGGIIVLTGGLTDDFLVKLAVEVPVVVTGRNLEAPGLHSLSSNDFHGAFVATQHLLELGHTRIAHITGDQTHPDAHERERGYRAAMDRAGVEVDSALIVEGNYLEASGAAAVERLLDRDRGFTAIFAGNDQMATGAVVTLQRRGMHIPQDVSIVGFDGLRGGAFTSPPITTVDLSINELGRRAAAAMLQLLGGEKPSTFAPEPEFVLRSSTRQLL